MNPNETRHGMTMRYPATRWQDALPTGSGVVGALVYGSIQSDTVVLNHDALYYPTAQGCSLDVSDQLPEMHELIRAGKCRESAQLMERVYTERLEASGGTAGGVAPYQPFCSIFLKAGTDGAFNSYRRGIDFESGRAWVRYSDNAATFTRETFVSRLTDTVYLRIRSTVSGTVSCRVALGETVSEQLNERDICHSSGGNPNFDTAVEVSGENQTLVFRGCYEQKLSFGAVGQLTVDGGSVTATDEALVIEGADEVVLQVRLFCDEDPAAAVPRLLAELSDGGTDYGSAFAAHTAEHGELFGRVSLALGGKQVQGNEAMLMAAYDGEVPASLIQTMFDFGRYLLICSSRAGGWPANLQGIWNGDYAPAWNCDIHTDENVQMNYWPALPGGLAETALPLFDYFEKHLDDFRENAKNNYGCRGIHVPLAMTTNGTVTPLSYSKWTAGAGWIAQHFYDYYLFTGDLDFLRERVVPFLREIALFYEDFLRPDEDGVLCFIPSLSPENRPGNGNSLVSINATMDVAVCREVLTNLCDACDVLGLEEEAVPRWRSMLERMPAYAVNGDGALREWLHPDFDDNYHHRHQSHLYPIFPGLEITKESNPEIFEAGRIAVEKRLVVGLTSQTGWSMGHMANSYARLGEGDRALECLELLTRGSTGPNLFTYHNDWRQMGLTCGGGSMPPFQIDANFGITAAVLEVLVFSKPGLIKLLPALPAKWRSGKVTGICCRGGVTVDMAWDLEQGAFSATLTSRVAQRIHLQLPEAVGQVRFDPDTVVPRDTVTGGWDVRLRAGAPLVISAGVGS
ncbi:MAG: glycoside hydrolase family 95 protein [Verrucomicrobia bacterium]|jgi:alpha-L-fucosidase 2|nr:glycoside hydrolase family 95 protein [Verrucomicrobiota bacterium]MBT7065668.1 glycoside hydrolase family 95 protein [Verrucomicrobiota bacterium]MBT7701832.1 glycoside hydrolase family 95 protein [Verrucomicrobiota bacterium]